jgi:hypothetical protein
VQRCNKWDWKIINDMDGSSTTEMYSSKLNDDTSEGKELIWGPQGKRSCKSTSLCCEQLCSLIQHSPTGIFLAYVFVIWGMMNSGGGDKTCICKKSTYTKSCAMGYVHKSGTVCNLFLFFFIVAIVKQTHCK